MTTSTHPLAPSRNVLEYLLVCGPQDSLHLRLLFSILKHVYYVHSGLTSGWELPHHSFRESIVRRFALSPTVNPERHPADSLPAAFESCSRYKSTLLNL